ncbi:MAG: hypothetical protein U0325_23150 [Polyangiales bacterium]
MLAPAAARAQPASLALTWTAPPGCPDADAILRRVRDLRAADHPTAPLPATATVTRDARRGRVRIETPRRRARPRRPACASLTEATAVVLASPSTTPRPPPPPTGLPVRHCRPRSNSSPTPSARPCSALPHRARPRHRRRAHNGPWAARALVDVNALPDTGFGVLLTAAWRARWLRVELAPTVAFASRGTPAPQGSSLEALRVTLATRVCVTGRDAAVGLCALVDAGWLRARAQGFTVPGDGDAPWLKLGASAFARLGTGRTTEIVALDLAAPSPVPASWCGKRRPLGGARRDPDAVGGTERRDVMTEGPTVGHSAGVMPESSPAWPLLPFRGGVRSTGWVRLARAAQGRGGGRVPRRRRAGDLGRGAPPARDLRGAILPAHLARGRGDAGRE